MSHRHFTKFSLRLPWFSKRSQSISPSGSSKQFSDSSPIMSSSKTLKDFGYAFNAQGQLRKIDEDGQPGTESFQFNVSDCHKECQTHYEELCDAMTDYVYNLLETDVKLFRLPVPKDSKPGNGTFIYVSKDFDQKEVLIILIHGSGPVRAGQWARKLIINENIDSGTQIPYIKKALARGYGVMVLNTNDNCQKDGKKIPNSSTAEEHSKYVWNTYVANTKSKSIVIVTHSYGGVVTLTLASELGDKFNERVKAVAFTDSVHSYSNIKISTHLKKIARNWISSCEPLDTPVITPEYDITRVSAGHERHDMTSCKCIDSVYKYIEEKLCGSK